MATPKQSIPGIPEPEFRAGAVVSVLDGEPYPENVHVGLNGTIHFVNLDATDYRIRFYTPARKHHPDVGVLLSARSSASVIVDIGDATRGECYYVLLPFNICDLASDEKYSRFIPSFESAAAESLSRADAVVDTLTHNPSPNPPILPGKYENKSRGTGPGGGIITVP